jgi:hypothetical protein
MFDTATDSSNICYNNYVHSLVKDINKTIFVDVHGRGERPINYFRNVFGMEPYIFLISAGNKQGLPKTTQTAISNGRFFSLVYESKGSPIEMLNYDQEGTLLGFSDIGPIRDDPEYPYDSILPYHNCMKYALESFHTLIQGNKYECNLRHLKSVIRKIFSSILETRPSISELVDHISKHKLTIINNSVLNNLVFDKIINDSGVYGVVWKGFIKGNPCAIKMVAIEDDNQNLQNTSNRDGNIVDDHVPFLHGLFKTHKHMLQEKFLLEASNQIKLSKLGLAPKVYVHFISDKSHTKYGFLVMELLTCSLKDIITTRELTVSEDILIKALIKETHFKYGLVHGDLKPSNIGVFLDNHGFIRKCLLLDCSKIKYRSDFQPDYFRHKCLYDLKTYRKHYISNRNDKLDLNPINNFQHLNQAKLEDNSHAPKKI